MSVPRTFRFAVVPKFSIFEVKRDEDGNFIHIDGYENKVLILLSKALNYKFRIVMPRDEQWGAPLGNGSWSGAVGMLQRDEADLAMSRITITYERAEVAWASFPYHFQNIIFATKLPTVHATKMAYLHPFTTSLWFIVLAFFILMPVVLRLLLKRRISWQVHAFNSVKLLLHQYAQYKRVFASTDRFLLLTFYVGVFLLSMGYNSVILSVLAVPPKLYGIETISQLAETVKKGEIKTTMPRGSFVLQYLLDSKISSARYLGEMSRDNDWEIEPSDAKIKKAMMEDGYAFITTDFYVKTRWPTKLLFSKENFGFNYVAIFAKKDFCCKSEIDMFVQRLLAAGLYEKIVSDFSFRLRLKSPLMQEDEVNLTLTMWELSEAFSILIFGLSLSVIVWIFEWLYMTLK
ncbi:glutamate receptor ionotropic, kainate glr-3-like [Parasteatoda tepidariorum]|uniref:glutamate receptor ionotropic, kainate glr-3-like n=1 Tax=Parasteatoda tepidariorum TaxID=114398 RepID=UPI001C720076|nr:glutamate receptor-like [Parasteatoda tepidariorum]